MIDTNKLLWKVTKTHLKEAYNDSDEYSICNYNDDIVSKTSCCTNYERKYLNIICEEHNKIIFNLLLTNRE